MTAHLARRLAELQPSASLNAVAIVAALRSEGRDILALTVGEPSAPTPPHVIEAAIAALRDGKTQYAPTRGIAPMVAAIRADFAAGGLSYTDRQITVGTGAKQLIFAAFAATIDPGDEVIVPAPYWVSYPDIARLFGATPVMPVCPADTGFKLTPERLAAVITPSTRWLVLNSPGNPSGAVYTRDELAALGTVLANYPDCLVLSDEIYRHIVYRDGGFCSFAVANPTLAERTLTVDGVSKGHAMTGFRLGYAGGPEWLVTAMVNVITQDTSCASSVSQWAALAALTGDQSALAVNRAEYRARRDQLLSRLDAIDAIEAHAPDGAFYVFASVAALIGARTPDGTVLATDADIADYLLRAAGVATMAGGAYGLSPYLRLSFATSAEVIDRATAGIADAIAWLEIGAQQLDGSPVREAMAE